jgi:hypothetical protein
MKEVNTFLITLRSCFPECRQAHSILRSITAHREDVVFGQSSQQKSSQQCVSSRYPFSRNHGMHFLERTVQSKSSPRPPPLTSSPYTTPTPLINTLQRLKCLSSKPSYLPSKQQCSSLPPPCRALKSRLSRPHLPCASSQSEQNQIVSLGRW